MKEKGPKGEENQVKWLDLKVLKLRVEEIEKIDPERNNWVSFDEKVNTLLLIEEVKLQEKRASLNKFTVIPGAEPKAGEISIKDWRRKELELNEIEKNAKFETLEKEKNEIIKLPWNGDRSVKIIDLSERQVGIINPEFNSDKRKNIAYDHEAKRLETMSYKLDHPSDKIIVQNLLTTANTFRSEAKRYNIATQKSTPKAAFK